MANWGFLSTGLVLWPAWLVMFLNVGQRCEVNLSSVKWVPTAVLWQPWQDHRGFTAGQMSQFTEGQTSEAAHLTSFLLQLNWFNQNCAKNPSCLPLLLPQRTRGSLTHGHNDFKCLHRGEKPSEPPQNDVMASSPFCKLEVERHKLVVAQTEQQLQQPSQSRFSSQKGISAFHLLLDFEYKHLNTPFDSTLKETYTPFQSEENHKPPYPYTGGKKKGVLVQSLWEWYFQGVF